MDGYRLLLSRRTIYEFRPEPVPLERVRRALDAGRWAQNHKLTEPWRFTIVGPQTRQLLGEVHRQTKLADLSEKSPDKADKQLRKIEIDVQKLVNLPALVVVSMLRSPDDFFRERENFAAVCCAIQNVALALWDDEIGMQWSTGKVTRHPETYRLLDIDALREEIVAFLKIGFPAEIPPGRRQPLDVVARELL